MENFISWYNQKMDEAEFNRLGVGAFMILFHTCVVIPVTLLVLSYNDFNVIYIGTLVFLSFAILFVVIAVVPSRISIPLFLASTIVHIIMIGLNFIAH